MNKKINQLLASIALLASLFLMNTAKSANASITVSSSSSTVVVGTKISVSYKVSSGSALGAWDFQLITPSNFTLNSCNNSQLAHQVGVVSNSNTYSTTITCSFTAKSTGSATFGVKNYQIEGYSSGTMAITPKTKTIKVITQKELENSYSKNNNLKSLEVAGYSLSPTFDKNTLIYSVELPPETYKVTINASKEDSSASIEGTGEKKLEDGVNTVSIVVTAQNKSTKTYTVNITVKELEPINVKIGEEDFTVVRKSNELKKPNDYFKETKIRINDKDVPAFINEATNTTIIGLKNKSGDVKLYIYEEKNNDYTLFKNIQGSNLSIEATDKSDNIPDIYKKQTIKIENIEYTVYKLNKNSTYSLFIGKNLENGEESIYVYDEKDKTIQKYNNEELTILEKDYKKLKQNTTYTIIGLSIILLVTYVTILLKVLNRKKDKELVIKDKKDDNNIKDKKEKKSEELVKQMEEELDFFDNKSKKRKK